MMAQNQRVDSTGIAEFVAIYLGVKIVIGIRHVMEELFKMSLSSIPIYSDSRAAVGISSTLDTHSTKHLNTVILCTKDYVASGDIKVIKIQADHQIADLLTKPVSRKVLKNCIDCIFKV